jgi:hypothetical protein
LDPSTLQHEIDAGIKAKQPVEKLVGSWVEASTTAITPPLRQHCGDVSSLQSFFYPSMIDAWLLAFKVVLYAFYPLLL